MKLNELLELQFWNKCFDQKLFKNEIIIIGIR